MNYLELATFELYGHGDWYYDRELFVNNTDLHFDKMKISSLAIELKKRDDMIVVIDNFNAKRDNDLNSLVIDSILCSEDQLKNMFVAYALSSDNEIIKWITIDNKIVEFSKDDFLNIIKRGKVEIEKIYFKYRVLKDQANGVS